METKLNWISNENNEFEGKIWKIETNSSWSVKTLKKILAEKINSYTEQENNYETIWNSIANHTIDHPLNFDELHLHYENKNMKDDNNLSDYGIIGWSSLWASQQISFSDCKKSSWWELSAFSNFWSTECGFESPSLYNLTLIISHK